MFGEVAVMLMFECKISRQTQIGEAAMPLSVAGANIVGRRVSKG